MDFYCTLSEFYDEIFPLKAAQKTFLDDYLRQESLRSVLDIGCGTGTLALELGKTGVKVCGVDLSREMIEISKRKGQESGSSAVFAVADMRDLSSLQEQFEGIICLGNTLAHVAGEIELRQVLHQFREKGRHLVLQIVNYDRVLTKQIKEFPKIQTEHLIFSRFYTHRSDGKLDFEMKIEFPGTKESVSGINCLYPITWDCLKKALLVTGWEVTGLWGNFAKEPWTEDSPATVLSAKRRAG